MTGTDVLIAGAGPVGTTLAMDLARLGVSSTLLEQRRNIPPNPRCNTTNARSMELFRRLGCADAVRGAGLPADFNTDVVFMTRLNGVEITRFKRSTPAEVRAGAQHGVAANWPTAEPQHFLSQIFLEPVLRDHAVKHWGVNLQTGWQLVSFEQDDAGVTSCVEHVDTAEQRTVRSRYLVGCDGAGSIVRKAIGSRLEGMPGMNNMCSTYFRSKRVTELMQRSPGWMLRFIGGGILVAIDGDLGWLLHNGVPAGEDPMTWDPEEAMFGAIGEPFDYEVIDRSRWSPRAMVATRWREGHVFLAGDAAHVWVPMGGFGMNAGVADAISLSWRLAAVHAGWGADGLLDSYEIERAPLGATIASQAVGWALASGTAMRPEPGRVERLESDPAARAELDEQIVRDTLSEFECPGFQLGYVYRDSPVSVYDDLTPEPEPMVVEYRATSWPGARLPHVWLADGSSIYDRLGDGFTLLQVGADAPNPDVLVTAFGPVPLAIVDVDADVVGDAWDGVPLVLVRPDQHIAWRSGTSPSADEAREVVEVVTGRRCAQPTPEPIAGLPPGLVVGAEATSADGQMRYRICADGVDQVRAHADGTESAARPFVRAAAGVTGVGTDSTGGLWVVGELTARYDGAGRVTHVVDETLEAQS